MSDLISRRDVNDVIDELEVYTYGRPNTMKVEVSVLQLQRLINKLKNIPTVYDIGKVVKELEELKNKDICDYLDCDVCLYYKKCGVETDQSNNLKWDKAIEIVKQGMEDIPSESGVLPKDVYSDGYNKAIEDYHRLIADEIKNDPVNPYLLHLYNFNNHIKKCLTKR